MGDIITGLENIRFDMLFLIVGVYLLVLWLVITAWVWLDAKKRFHTKYAPHLSAVFVFFGNFPALIIYMIIRPEEFWVLGESPIHASNSRGEVSIADDKIIKLALDAEGKKNLLINLTFALEESQQSDDEQVDNKIDASMIKATVVEATPAPKSDTKAKLFGFFSKTKNEETAELKQMTTRVNSAEELVEEQVITAMPSSIDEALTPIDEASQNAKKKKRRKHR